MKLQGEVSGSLLTGVRLQDESDPLGSWSCGRDVTALSTLLSGPIVLATMI